MKTKTDSIPTCKCWIQNDDEDGRGYNFFEIDKNVASSFQWPLNDGEELWYSYYRYCPICGKKGLKIKIYG